MNIVERSTFSTNIFEFLKAMLADDWENKYPNSVFIRDYESLPDSAAHDVDILVASEEREAILSSFVENATKHNLVHISKSWETGALFF